MAYSPAIHGVMMFGGSDGTTDLSDLWLWDGTGCDRPCDGWYLLSRGGTSSNPSPAARHGAAMAKFVRGAQTYLLLFGGSSNGTDMADTWELNGSAWSQVASPPQAAPPARDSAAMAYDTATHQLILFGGTANGADLSDTWTWNGNRWNQLSPATVPPARHGATLGTDPVTGALVLFGGMANGADLSDTWTWDGSNNNWVEDTPATSPPARDGAVAGYDAGTGQLILFGGSSAGSDLADTWAWDGVSWTQLQPPTSPSGRDGAAFAYQPDTGQTVIFGGTSAGATLSDTWAYLTPPVVSLGNLGCGHSEADRVLSNGDVVGQSCLASGASRVFYWTSKGGVMTDIGTLGGNSTDLIPGVSGTCGCYQFDVNDSGQVAGESQTPSLRSHAFMWSQSGGMTDLGVLPGDDISAATGINSIGQVVGYSISLTTSQTEAFSWTAPGPMVPLAPGYSYSRAEAVNDNGQVVGTAQSSDGVDHAFLWSASAGMVDLGHLPGDVSAEAYAINGSGQVVGTSNDANGDTHPFFWTAPGPMIDLGTLGNGTDDEALALNDNGQVVGSGITSNSVQHAFLWTQSGGMIDLGATVEGAVFQSSTADTINDLGQVGGQVVAATGQAEGFIWTAARGMTPAGVAGGDPSSEVKDVNSKGVAAGDSTTDAGPIGAVTWNPNATKGMSLGSSSNPSVIGQQVTYTAAVAPIPDGGTVTFMESSFPISGCAAIPVDPSNGSASCSVMYSALGRHSISASYSGDASFGPREAVPLTQSVTYGVAALYNQTAKHNSGASVPLRMELTDFTGKNLSASQVRVTFVSLTPSPAPGYPPPSGSSFTFMNLDSGPGYQLNVKTSGYPPRTYTLRFSVSGDLVTHVLQFVVNPS